MLLRYSILLIVTLCVQHASLADTVTVGGQTYEDVYVTETAKTWIICFPSEGTTKSFGKLENPNVKIDKTEDDYVRETLYLNWKKAAELRKSTTPNPPSSRTRDTLEPPRPDGASASAAIRPQDSLATKLERSREQKTRLLKPDEPLVVESPSMPDTTASTASTGQRVDAASNSWFWDYVHALMEYRLIRWAVWAVAFAIGIWVFVVFAGAISLALGSLGFFKETAKPTLSDELRTQLKLVREQLQRGSMDRALVELIEVLTDELMTAGFSQFDASNLILGYSDVPGVGPAWRSSAPTRRSESRSSPY